MERCFQILRVKCSWKSASSPWLPLKYLIKYDAIYSFLVFSWCCGVIQLWFRVSEIIWVEKRAGKIMHCRIHSYLPEKLVFPVIPLCIISGWMQSCVQNLVSSFLHHVWHFYYLIMLLSRQRPRTQWRLVNKWSEVRWSRVKYVKGSGVEQREVMWT